MVVKWSSEKDQFILCHILEDKNIKISNDVLDSMIAAWRMYSCPLQPLPFSLVWFADFIPSVFIPSPFLMHLARCPTHMGFCISINPCCSFTLLSIITILYQSCIRSIESRANLSQPAPSVTHPPERLSPNTSPKSANRTRPSPEVTPPCLLPLPSPPPRRERLQPAEPLQSARLTLPPTTTMTKPLCLPRLPLNAESTSPLVTLMTIWTRR